MDFLRKLIIPDYWYWYDIISAIFGLLMCIVIKKKRKYDIYISLIISTVNAFWLGAFVIFRFYYNAASFWCGGLAGVLLVLFFYLFFKGKEMTYLAALFICAKILCLFCNLFIETSYGRIEELIILFSYFLSVILIGIYKMTCNINKYDIVSNIFFPLYGSFLITGSCFDYFHEIVYDIPDYLIEKSEYINLYKYILKVDWTKNGETIIFLVLFIFLFIIGIILRKHEIIEKGINGK